MAGGVLAEGAELAILYNGNSIAHERRQVVGQVTRLYLSDSAESYIEIPSDQIERFEIDSASRFQPAAGQLSSSPGAQAPTRGELDRLILGAGERNQVDPDFINSVIRAESGFHPFAVSKKGARGLMQLMPQTASQLGVQNAFDPGANVEGGARYLRELLEKYNFDAAKALAAYNAGPGRVDQYHGVPPYYETQAYVRRIIRDFNRQKLAEHPELADKPKSVSAGRSSGTGIHQHSSQASTVPSGRSVSDDSSASSR